MWERHLLALDFSVISTMIRFLCHLTGIGWSKIGCIASFGKSILLWSHFRRDRERFDLNGSIRMNSKPWVTKILIPIPNFDVVRGMKVAQSEFVEHLPIFMHIIYCSFSTLIFESFPVPIMPFYRIYCEKASRERTEKRSLVQNFMRVCRGRSDSPRGVDSQFPFELTPCCYQFVIPQFLTKIQLLLHNRKRKFQRLKPLWMRERPARSSRI
jgi:hypothetical protein